MFSIEKVGTFPGAHYNVSNLYVKQSGRKQHICTVVHWGFNSCACFHLQQFGNYAPCGVDVNAMFEFLDNYGSEASYKPKEYYFMLSGTQLQTIETDLFKNMVAHPCVQQIDKFENKSHQSKGVSLFRYSAAKDFVFPTEG